jgi:hypothetical protein
MYYRKKLDYQEARVKELLKRPACMLTSLRLSRNLNSKITVHSWHIAVGSRHSLMRIQEYWTTHGLATRHGFTYPVMWIPKTRLWGTENPHAMFEEHWSFYTESWMKYFDGGFRPPNCSTILAILNWTSNPIGLHNERSLLQRMSIHLHYDVKASKHLASLLTTDWNVSSKQVVQPSLFVFSIFILSYLIFSFLVTNFLFANSQNTQPHFITGMTCKYIVLLFFL